MAPGNNVLEAHCMPSPWAGGGGGEVLGHTPKDNFEKCLCPLRCIKGHNFWEYSEDRN